MAGLLALALAGPDPARWLRALNALAAAVLVLWGGANVLIGGLVLAGAIVPSTPVDERALRWHVCVWDLWFLVWGIALAVALLALRRRG